MSRVYEGSWQCLLMVSDDLGYLTPESSYEHCEKILWLIGLGIPYQGHHIIRAKIIASTTSEVLTSDLSVS